MTSTAMCRFRPLTFLGLFQPRLAFGTLSAVRVAYALDWPPPLSTWRMQGFPGKPHSQGMTRTAAPDRTLPASSPGHVSNAPIEPVAIADWHMRLSSGERARCLPPTDIALWVLRPGRLIVVYTAPKPADQHRRLCERGCRPECASRTPGIPEGVQHP